MTSTPLFRGCLAPTLAILLAIPASGFGAPPSSAWPLVRSDEFNDSSLDDSKWRSGELPWGGRHHTDEYADAVPPEGRFTQQALDGGQSLRCVRYLAPPGGPGNVVELEFSGRVEVHPPPLTAVLDPDRRLLTLSWPSWGSDYRVDRAAALLPAADWQPVAEPAQEGPDILFVTVPVTLESNERFRLQQHPLQP